MQVYNIPLDNTHQETTQHGNFAFPLAIYTTQINKNILGYIDWHWHHELQFCVILRGEVEFFVNQSQFLLKKGDGIFVNTEQLHMAKNHASSDSVYICLDFHPRLIAGFSGSIMESQYVVPYLKKPGFTHCLLSPDVDWQKQILDHLLSVSASFHSRQPDQMQIAIQLATIWHVLITSASATISGKNGTLTSPQVRDMLRYIRSNYMNPVSLDEIAEQVSLARSTCCREFKRQMGCTIFEHLLNVRLQEASRLLLTSNANITEISIRCGFASSSYFTKEFRRKTGLSPSAYRKEKLKNRAEILSTI